jgi:hypothetical protein
MLSSCRKRIQLFVLLDFPQHFLPVGICDVYSDGYKYSSIYYVATVHVMETLRHERET